MYPSIYVQGSHKAVKSALLQVIRLEKTKILVIVLPYFIDSKMPIFFFILHIYISKISMRLLIPGMFYLSWKFLFFFSFLVIHKILLCLRIKLFILELMKYGS